MTPPDDPRPNGRTREPREHEPIPPATRRTKADTIATGLACLALVAIALPQIVSTPPWIDETYTIAAIEHLAESVQFSHFTMSGYYVILWVWATISSSLVWLRSFSLVCAVLTVLCVHQLALRISGRRLATVAVLIVPFLAMFQWKATEARSYALETLLVAICWLIVVSSRITRSRGGYWWAALVVVGVFGEFVHGLFFLQFLPIAVFVAATKTTRSARIGAIMLVVFPVLVAGGLWSAGADGVGMYGTGSLGDWVRWYLRAFLGFRTAIVAVLLGSLIFGLILRYRHRATSEAHGLRPESWIPALWVLTPTVGLIATSLLANRFNPRYLAPILPGLALLLGQAATSIDEAASRILNVSPPRSRAPLNIMARHVGSTLILGSVIIGTYLTPPFVTSPWRTIVDTVATRSGPDSCIIFAEVSDTSPAQMRTPFEVVWRSRHADRALRVISSDRQLDSPRRYDVSVPLDLVASRATHCDMIWVLSYNGFDQSSEDAYLSLPELRGALNKQQTWEWADGYVLTQLVRK